LADDAPTINALMMLVQLVAACTTRLTVPATAELLRVQVPATTQGLNLKAHDSAAGNTKQVRAPKLDGGACLDSPDGKPQSSQYSEAQSVQPKLVEQPKLVDLGVTVEVALMDEAVAEQKTT